MKKENFSMKNELSETEYKRLLYDLAQTPFYKAILMQSYREDTECMNTIISTDPFKDPTVVARAQGRRGGLYSLENEIKSIIEEISKIEKGNKEKKNEDFIK
jgi:hypothetical protein